LLGDGVESTEYGFIQLTLNLTSDAAPFVAQLDGHLETLLKMAPPFVADAGKPKISAEGNKIHIGFSFPLIPKLQRELKYKHIAPIIDQIKGVDQKLEYDIQIGASVKDVFKG
jgi:hypothetical protein